MADKAGEQPEIQKAGDQLGKETTAETFRADLGDRSSGDNQVSQKMPDAVKDALGLNSPKELSAYVDSLQAEGKGVLKTVDTKGREANLPADKQSDLMKYVTKEMTADQHRTELTRSFGAIAKATGINFQSAELKDLTPDGANKLMTKFSDALKDYMKKVE